MKGMTPVSNRIFSLILIVGLSTPTRIQAQDKDTETGHQLWLGYFNQTRLNKKWGLGAEIQLRTKENVVQGLGQLLIRTGMTYFLSEDARFTLGYAFVNFFPADNHKNISQPEHRPWQQFQWQTRYPGVRLMQWLRLEERFRRNIKNDDELGQGYAFNWRMRHQIQSQFPLSRKAFTKGTLSLVISNELFVNFGKQVTYNYFDQNRFYTGFLYHISNQDNLQVGYLNLFQQLPAGNRYKDIHTLRLSYFHNVSLIK